MNLLVIVVLSTLSYGQGISLCPKEGCDPPQIKKEKRQIAESEKKVVVKDLIQVKKASILRNQENSNLPQYHQGVDRSDAKASEKVMYVATNKSPYLNGLKSGDVIRASIEQAMVASPSVPTPIRAMALNGPFKNSFFLGEATLDRELKRVLLNFTKLRIQNQNTTYALKAQGLSLSGSVGLVGEYHSEAGKFFVAELAAATAAGYLDATTTRNQNAYGNYVQEPSVTNATKQGAVTALSRTADRAAEASRNAPEYTEVEGYQEIQIIITEDPTESR